MAYGPSVADNFRRAAGYVKPHPQGREAGGPANRAAGHDRADDQPQDRPRARPDGPAVAAPPGGARHRIRSRANRELGIRRRVRAIRRPLEPQGGARIPGVPASARAASPQGGRRLRDRRPLGDHPEDVSSPRRSRGIDPSEGFVAAARQRLRDHRVRLPHRGRDPPAVGGARVRRDGLGPGPQLRQGPRGHGARDDHASRSRAAASPRTSGTTPRACRWCGLLGRGGRGDPGGGRSTTRPLPALPAGAAAHPVREAGLRSVAVGHRRADGLHRLRRLLTPSSAVRARPRPTWPP